jgi:dTDP-4-dehydrorhamnose 3,5-epimerase
MDSSKFLIVGANGQLGTALREKYPMARAVGSEELDITNRAAVESFDWQSVTHILNAAGYTDVDGAETEEGRRMAWAVNADGVANLVSAAAQNDAVLVHISSDYVFDGTLDNHSEDEGFAPLSTYGASKAAGDLAVSLTPKFYLLRTSWVIGEGKNFVRTMLGLGDKGVSPTVVADQIGRLTFTSELVRIIDHLLSADVPFGTYNATNDGEPASWADVTRETFRLGGYDLQVTDTTTAEYFAGKEGVAPRPLNSVLNLDKLHATGFLSRDWREDLAEYINKEKQA